jgi:hypothetical protein
MDAKINRPCRPFDGENPYCYCIPAGTIVEYPIVPAGLVIGAIESLALPDGRGIQLTLSSLWAQKPYEYGILSGTIEF